MKRILAAGCLLLSCISAGCSVPQPVEPTNAATEGYYPPYEYPVGYNKISRTGDTVLIAEYQRCYPYANKRISWHFNDKWSWVSYGVQHVVKGQWTPKTLQFIVRQSTPTPESHLPPKTPDPLSYKPGTVFAFALDTTQSPPQVVSQQLLAPTNIPPYPDTSQKHKAALKTAK